MAKQKVDLKEIEDQVDKIQQTPIPETEETPKQQDLIIDEEVKTTIVKCMNTSYNKVATTNIYGEEVLFAARETKILTVPINWRGELQEIK